MDQREYTPPTEDYPRTPEVIVIDKEALPWGRNINYNLGAEPPASESQLLKSLKELQKDGVI